MAASLLPVLAVIGVLAAFEGHHPLLEGVEIGVVATVGAGGCVFFFWGVEGSLVARIALMYESAATDGLERRPGVFHVVRNVEFYDFDVDAVVICRAGVFAFEVKSMTLIKPKEDLDGLARNHWADQACRSARRIAFLLRSKGLEIDVHPVVEVIGPGVPTNMPSYAHMDGVRWVTARRSGEWEKRLALGAFDRGTGEEVRRAIESYMDQFVPAAPPRRPKRASTSAAVSDA